ncbi:hypothetical protein M378DRAFT_11635 [Amanita muscaria Koide BX008]|uniref:DNA polymerase eta n=1 Tax=Amanita muscaria (strain Koide BX008) TaxID=946122 RepID=A0A0C2X4R6_AMAMK|nr:hypothetical protein M378DRAFT_11635 [Amanita muscaria Koide BX008]
MAESPRKPLSAASPWKGKGRATEQDFEANDLNPPITYRHLLSQNLGVRDPLRVIALCDSDAFYAACEMVRLKTAPDIPLVEVKDAKKRCPGLVVVHVATYKEGESEPGYWDNVNTNTHKVSLDYYRNESIKVAAKFKECLPECEIGVYREAFFAFTRPVRKILLEQYPYLAQVPSDAPHEIDTILPRPPPMSWNGLGHVIPINPAPSSSTSINNDQTNDDATSGVAKELEVGVDEADDDRVTTTWHDVALSIASELMDKARVEVYKQLGYSTSAGIARNKFLAKMTASYKKPNSQSILRNAAIPNYLKPIPFQKIRFLGGKFGKAIAEEFEASTVGDLLFVPHLTHCCMDRSITKFTDELQRKFGEESIWVHEVLRGIDRNEVKEKSVVNKSMMASKNLPQAINQVSEGYHWIRVLAAELALRLKNARQTDPNLWPKTLVLHARKYPDAGRSKQSAFPFTREITVDVVAAAGDKLWKELFGNDTKLNVSHVALGFTGIDVTESGQQSIETFLKLARNHKRLREPDEAGESVSMEQNPALRTNEMPNTAAEADFSSRSYTCSKCCKTLTVFLDSDTDRGDDPLETVRREHDDFHYAESLAREMSQPLTVASSSSGTRTKRTNHKNKKRRGDEPKGIEKFLMRK